MDRLLDRYDVVVERLVGLPTTVIHGELYASNVLVERGRGALRVGAVDWEMAALGPGIIDLAALSTGGGWQERDREALARSYLDGLTPASRRPLADDFPTLLDCARLHLAVQWLGWALGWTPPAAHAHDWLGEALDLGDRLGL